MDAEMVLHVTGLNYLSKSDAEKIAKSVVLQNELKYAQTLFNRVNKRIRNIERNRDIVSPAYNALKSKRGDAPRFGTSGSYSNIKELQKEIAQAQAFDNMETSSVSGARAFTNNLKSQLNVKSVRELSPDFISDIFDALHALHERMPDELYKNQLQYAEYLDTIIEVVQDKNSSELNSAESINDTVNQAIDKLSQKIADNYNDVIDEMRNRYNSLF